MFDFSNYLPNLKYCDDPKEFVVGKMKSETDGVAIELGLKPQMHSFLVDDNSECKKAKGVNKNVAKKGTHNEYKGVLLNNV